MKANEELAKCLINISEIADNLQYRINKAIEYIEIKTKDTDFDNDRLIDVLEILKGSDKE